MDKTLVSYIVSSIECWGENQKIGEEIRELKSNIYNHLTEVDDPVLEVIYELIFKYSDNERLGYEIRKIYIPLKFYVNDKTIID
jgi:hypothetical protein